MDLFRRAPATAILIAVNVVIFAYTLLTPSGMSLYANGTLVPADLMSGGPWWTLLTSMFLHGSITHILCNMISLYSLGEGIESLYGTIRFLIIYFVSGILGGLAYVFLSPITGNPLVGCVGASGAIFGLFGAEGFLMLKERIKPCLLVRPSHQMVTSWFSLLALNLFIGFINTGIAWEGHLGGLIGGFVCGAVLYFTIGRVMKSNGYGI